MSGYSDNLLGIEFEVDAGTDYATQLEKRDEALQNAAGFDELAAVRQRQRDEANAELEQLWHDLDADPDRIALLSARVDVLEKMADEARQQARAWRGEAKRYTTSRRRVSQILQDLAYYADPTTSISGLTPHDRQVKAEGQRRLLARLIGEENADALADAYLEKRAEEEWDAELDRARFVSYGLRA